MCAYVSYGDTVYVSVLWEHCVRTYMLWGHVSRLHVLRGHCVFVNMG